jgi:hypothetical protein
MAGAGDGSADPAAAGPDDAQAHITSFWSGVAAGYEARSGHVAGYGSAEYQRWVDALAAASVAGSPWPGHGSPGGKGLGT